MESSLLMKIIAIIMIGYVLYQTILQLRERWRKQKKNLVAKEIDKKY